MGEGGGRCSDEMSVMRGGDVKKKKGGRGRMETGRKGKAMEVTKESTSYRWWDNRERRKRMIEIIAHIREINAAVTRRESVGKRIAWGGIN